MSEEDGSGVADVSTGVGADDAVEVDMGSIPERTDSVSSGDGEDDGDALDASDADGSDVTDSDGEDTTEALGDGVTEAEAAILGEAVEDSIGEAVSNTLGEADAVTSSTTHAAGMPPVRAGEVTPAVSSAACAGRAEMSTEATAASAATKVVTTRRRLAADTVGLRGVRGRRRVVDGHGPSP